MVSCVGDLSQDLPREPAENVEATETSGEEAEPMIHQLPQMVEQIGGFYTKGFHLTFKRDDREMKMVVDLSLDAESKKKFDLSLLSKDFQMNLTLANEKPNTSMEAQFQEVIPDRFLKLLEVLIDYDGRIVPDGFELGGAELLAELSCEGHVMTPLKMTGTLTDVFYDGGDEPVQFQAKTAMLELIQDFEGIGHVVLSGGMNGLSLPLDPSAGFVLEQKSNPQSRWQTRISWGSENAALTARLEKINLGGAYDDKPIRLDDFQADISLLDDDFTLDGSFSNDGTQMPLKYSHTMTQAEDDEGDWKLAGIVQLGPVKHERPLPLLSAVTDLFDDMEVTGETSTEFKFSVGAYDPFEGVLSTRASNLSVTAGDGLVKSEGLNGTFKLHVLSLTSASPDEGDPSYYTLDFTSKKLHIGSKDALDFDLDHSAETPVTIKGKGKLGDVSKLDGKITNFTLHGEHDGYEIDLVDSTLIFAMLGDQLKASGSFQLKENKIPFTYMHVKKDVGDDWDLAGIFEIKSADLKEPIDNGGIMVEAMDGISMTGKVAMKMDFTVGGEKDFDGVLTAAMLGGTLTFEDDGPVLDGVKGDIRLSSMKEKQTAGYHRVTATDIKAFDIEMTNARLDYQMLPNGDIKLRSIALKALGGNVWLDPFVLPGDDSDYKFKVRMKHLSLAQLAALFPEFNGRIIGSIDGLLPMQCKNGDFMPQRGGMYLTPGKGAKLIYDAGNKFSGGLDPKGREYQQMKMVEDSLKNLELRVLSIRLFDPRDKDKAVVMKLQGQAPSVPRSPPIILNINGFKPDDDTVDFFDLLLKHRDKLNFGL